jgi:putative MATE family efflux protein
MSASTLWTDIKGSVAGNEYDFTTGSIRRAILLLSIPMVLEMMMESVFAIADIFFVSKLGPEAVAAVGLTEGMMTILYAIAMGLSMGTTAIVARRIGEGNKDAAAVAGVQGIFVSAAVSIPFMIAGIFYAPELLKWMGASETIQADMSLYATIMLGGNIGVILLFVINAIFRGAGDAAISMRVLIYANALNIVLDPILIFGLGPIPAMGIAGAAIATTFSRGLAVVYQLYMLTGRSNRIAVFKHDWVVDFSIVKSLVRLSLGGMGQFLIGTASWVVLIRILAEFGSNVLAGYTIAIRIFIFSLLPSWGMSNAAATLVGQNLGAGNPDRAEYSAWLCGGINTVFLVFVGISYYIFAENMMSWFTSDSEVIAVGVRCLKIICLGYLIYGMGMVMAQSFNGAGDTVTPTILNFIAFWIIEIPLAYFLANSLGWREDGVFWSIVIAESILGIMAMILFKRGTWKTKLV